MPIIRIDRLDFPGVEMFARLTEAELRSRKDPSKAVLIAESPKVIRVTLDAGYVPVALLCEERHIEGDAQDVILRISRGSTCIYRRQGTVGFAYWIYTDAWGALCDA